MKKDEALERVVEEMRRVTEGSLPFRLWVWKEKRRSRGKRRARLEVAEDMLMEGLEIYQLAVKMIGMEVCGRKEAV